jgi:hypothetical protein
MAISEFRSLQDQISRTPQLSGGSLYWQYARDIAGRPIVQKPGNQIATIASALTTTKELGDHPAGFGKGFDWDRKDKEILLAVFINAADFLGVCISGVEAGDVLQVTSCTGVASFAEDTGNPLAESIVGLVASAAEIGAPLVGIPAAVPFIEAAEAFAKEQFKATNAKTKRRDAFGVDPGSGHRARQEGGVLITLPEAGGPFYSGDSDHQSRWIKSPGDRTDVNLPSHVSHAFFPRHGDTNHNTRTLHTAGEIYITPWDYKFEDNAGYYKIFIKLGVASPSNEQPNWRWCHKCQGMFFGGNSGSVCPAGGAHDATGSGNYSVAHDTPAVHGQQDWRWCHKCQGMFFGGNPGSVCPVGGAHDATGSGNYSLRQV